MSEGQWHSCRWPYSCNLNNNSANSIKMSQVTNISFWFFFSTWSNGVHSWWWPVWDIFFVSNIFFLFQIFFSNVKQWCALLVVACGGFGTMQPQSSSSLLADWHIKWNNKQTRADKYKNMQIQYIHTQINTKTTQTRNVKGTITIRDCWPTGSEQTATGKQKRMSENHFVQSWCLSEALQRF